MIQDRIRNFLKENKIHIVDAAQSMGISQPYLSNILSNRKKPNLKFIEKLANVYPTMDMNYIIRG